MYMCTKDGYNSVEIACFGDLMAETNMIRTVGSGYVWCLDSSSGRMEERSRCLWSFSHQLSEHGIPGKHN